MTRQGTAAQPINIQTIINEAVEKNNQYKALDRDASKFHISDAGGCYRARFLKRLGVPPVRVIDTPSLRKMLAGDAGHEKLQKLLWRNKKMFLAENEIETEHLKGHPDGILKDGGKCLVEFKTIEKWQMMHIKKTGAKQNHILQMFTYWMLLREDVKGLDQAILSYVKREDFISHDFYYFWSDDIKTKVEAEWKPLIKYWIDQKLPPCTCSTLFDGSGPKYCRYGVTETECCDEELFMFERG